jgi:trehalose 6-phosphate phosphatase
VIPVLSPEGERMIARLAADRALLAFDYDGTLAPIVADRERAEMRPSTRALLRVAAVLFPCAVVSGRARADVAARVASAPLVAVVGNHGAEVDGAPAEPLLRARIEAWAVALRGALRHVPGVDVEAKGLSLAVHHRAAGAAPDDVARIAALAATLPGARVFGGDGVVNVTLADAPTKGSAVEALASRERAGTVLFVGDDVTDEDAFRSPAVTFGVRVGASRRSRAGWYLEDQLEIDALLRALVAARRRHAGVGEPIPRRTAPSEPGESP